MSELDDFLKLHEDDSTDIDSFLAQHEEKKGGAPKPPNLNSPSMKAAERESAPPSAAYAMAKDFGSAGLDTVKDLGKAAKGVFYDLPIAAGKEAMAHPIATAMSPLNPLALTLGKGAWEGAKAAGNNVMTRGQAALDQERLLHDRMARGEDVGMFPPEQVEALRQTLHMVVPERQLDVFDPETKPAAAGQAMADLTIAGLPEMAGGVKAAAGAVGRPLLSGFRSLTGLSEGHAALQSLMKESPLSKLTLAERGGEVGAGEKLARATRKAEESRLYAPLNDATASASSLLDADLIGIKLPPSVEKALAAVKKAKANLASVRPDEVATSPELDLATSKLDDLPWQDIRKVRTQLGEIRTRLQGERRMLADTMYAKVSGALAEGAEAAGLKPEWDIANAFHRDEVAANHYTISRGEGDPGSIASMGKNMRKKGVVRDVPGTGAQSKMSDLLRPSEPGDIIAAKRALVPEGDWVPTSVTKSGQKAFDNLIEQKLTPVISGDPTKISKALADISPEVVSEMKASVSPEMLKRIESLEKVGAAYAKLGADSPLADLATGAAIGGKLGGPIGAALGATAGAAAKVSKLKPAVLRWALEHPARAEMLTMGMDRAASLEQLRDMAARNIAAVTRLEGMDSSRPPSLPSTLLGFAR